VRWMRLRGRQRCNGVFSAGRGVGEWGGSLRGIGQDVRHSGLDPESSGKQSRGVWPRTPITFFVRPKKVIKETPPRFTAASRYPALLDWSGGCGTRTACSNSPRRNPLTSLRYSAAHRGMKSRKCCVRFAHDFYYVASVARATLA
jgi:hypothetical protein